jgi:hypothetical protein
LHAFLGDRTVAVAILDRLVHNNYRLVLKGESMRKRKSAPPIRSRLNQELVDGKRSCLRSPQRLAPLTHGGPAS